jgi:hypothetical protein
LAGCSSKENQSNILRQKQGLIAEKYSRNGEINLQNGDLIFHTSRSNQSQAIQIATNSKYSHMGLLYKKGNDFFVYEAIQPVKFTKLTTWINRGKNGKYVVKRLKNSDEILTKEGLKKMKLEGEKYLGKDYDLQFKWSNEEIYCSELVWKIYKEAFNIEIGKLERISDFNLSDRVVQSKIKERYGNNVPENELVITPDRMFNDTKLITVKEK